MPYKSRLANIAYVVALWVAAIGLWLEAPFLYQSACWLFLGAVALNHFKK
jgi:hypothetical protein